MSIIHFPNEIIVEILKHLNDIISIVKCSALSKMCYEICHKITPIDIYELRETDSEYIHKITTTWSNLKFGAILDNEDIIDFSLLSNLYSIKCECMYIRNDDLRYLSNVKRISLAHSYGFSDLSYIKDAYELDLRNTDIRERNIDILNVHTLNLKGCKNIDCVRWDDTHILILPNGKKVHTGKCKSEWYKGIKKCEIKNFI